jgi:hypothetical protein
VKRSVIRSIAMVNKIAATQAHRLVQFGPNVLKWFQAQGGE